MRAPGRIGRRGLFFLSVGVLGAGNVLALPDGPLPLDLAYSKKTLRRYEQPVVSADGKWAVYEVYTPPLRSPDSELAEGDRFLPSGTPPLAVGLKAWVVPTAGGESRNACPEKGNCWRPSPSPDGSQVAVFSDAGGVPQVWIYDVAAGKVRRLSEAPIKAKHWTGDEAMWSPDGKEVFVLLRPAGQAPPPGAAPAPGGSAAPPPGAPLDKPTVAVYRTGGGGPAPAGGQAPPPDAISAHYTRENNAELAAIEVATGKTRIVVPADATPRPSNLRLSPDGKWLSYLSVPLPKNPTAYQAYYDIAVVPASGGKPVVVATDIAMPEQDYFGAVYRWIPGSTRIVYMKDRKLWVADAAAPTKPARALGASLGKLEEVPLLLAQNGRAVLVGQQAEGEKTYYFVPPKALALVPLDGSAPKVFPITGSPIAADANRLWESPSGTFAVVRSDDKTGDRSIVGVNPRTGATTTLWTGRGRFDAAGGAAGGGVIARFETLETPPDLYRFEPSFASKTRLTHVEPRLDSVKVGPMEMFASPVPGFDGRLQSVQTAVFLPPGKKPGEPLPTLVYFYAGSKMSDAAQEWGGGAPNSIPVQIFATRGYAVLLADVPLGPEGKGGNPIQEMADAILAQVYRAADRGYTDVSRVAIMGQSYGGYGTAAMVTQTNLFRAAMALDGLYDLGAMFGMMPPGGGQAYFWAETGQGRMGTHPWGDLRRYLANSPYYLADKIHTPLLLIHGKKDSLPVQESERMFNALRRLERTAELAVYEGEGHVPGYFSQVNAVDATQRMLDWLEKYAGPAAKP